MRKKKRKIDILRLSAILVILIAIVYFYLNILSPRLIPKSIRIATIREPINILIVGTDTTFSAETHKPLPNLKGRADTILIAHFNPIDSKISVLSIPRDTYAPIPGHDAQKINAANAYGGISLMKQTVEELIGQKIDYYIEIKPAAIAKFVDLLGGVYVNVEKNMYYSDAAQNLNINLKKGRQKLSGKQAHDYIRFRHDFRGDIGRIERQQAFLKALINTIINPTNIVKAPLILESALKETESDIPPQLIARIFNLCRIISFDNVTTAIISGEVSYVENIGSVWFPDQSAISEQIDEFF
jgi:LCP family protein required for cell wall assembly